MTSIDLPSMKTAPSTQLTQGLEGGEQSDGSELESVETSLDVTSCVEPSLADADVRSVGLVNVGIQLDASATEAAIYAITAAKRQSGHSFLGDFAAFLLANAATSQSQIFQDLFALFVTQQRRGGFFVEVGTGDGRLISNTYLLEKSFGWTGLVVEPNPVFLPALKQNRTCKIATDCVFDVTGRVVRFRCSVDPEFSGISASHGDLHDPRRAQGYTDIEMVTLSLNDTLERYGCPKEIDYLSLDVEGAEFVILQTFDFTRTFIKYISVEHNWTSSREHIYNLLTDHGYVRVFQHFSQWDDWYVHRNILAKLPAAADLIREERVATDPSRAHTFLQWALDAVSTEDWDVAETLCLRAEEINPGFSAAARTLAEVAMRRGERNLALQRWRAAVTADPADYWARIGLSEMLASRGAISEAVEHLHEAQALSSDNARALELLGELRPKVAGEHERLDAGGASQKL